MFNLRYFPNAWKTAVIIPILKPGKDPTRTDSHRPRFSFRRCGDMTSIPNWSDMTDSSVQPAATTTGLGASPSRVTTGDELIAEKSDLFREAIRARNVYAAWARKLTNARPNDPKLQEFHQEVTKAGESVNSLLTQLDVPLFRIPASEKELDKILLRLKNKPIDPPAVKNQESKTAAVPPSPPASPRKGKKAGKRSVDSEGFAPPPKQLVRKARSPRLSPPPSPTPLPRLLLKTRVWKARRRKWILRNRLSCKIRSWCPR
ncbi:hypothetical protein TNCV_1059651 [Trichonephila clavipes]|nr:hypothetical protein TNCV_1059651 [Trichonephila clavipes]